MVIKAYKCTVSEIWRDFFCIGMYCVYVVSDPTYRLYRVYETRKEGLVF